MGGKVWFQHIPAYSQVKRIKIGLDNFTLEFQSVPLLPVICRLQPVSVSEGILFRKKKKKRNAYLFYSTNTEFKVTTVSINHI